LRLMKTVRRAEIQQDPTARQKGDECRAQGLKSRNVRSGSGEEKGREEGQQQWEEAQRQQEEGPRTTAPRRGGGRR
jgi:hypothetical protein